MQLFDTPEKRGVVTARQALMLKTASPRPRSLRSTSLGVAADPRPPLRASSPAVHGWRVSAHARPSAIVWVSGSAAAFASDRHGPQPSVRFRAMNPTHSSRFRT